MDKTNHRYFMLNKPIDMVSQFISPDKVNLLGDLDFNFPEGTHAVGRLDNHSEGLLLLTTNKKVTRLLFSSDQPHKRTYLVQVNNILSPQSLQLLQTGISIKIKGGVNYTTPPCDVEIVAHPENLYKTAVTLSEFGPHTWLIITLTEGKYHQVRKMIGAVRHRCKRLIRISIESLELGNLAPGCILEIPEKIFFEKLAIEYDPE
ncbi:MAG: pseudouridine synthase [Ferruginibacter sp.]